MMTPSFGCGALASLLFQEIRTMAPFRRPTLPRSGRIKADGLAMGNQVVIVERANNASFRIYNTGEKTFTVQASGQGAITLKHRCSTDVRVTGNIAIIAAEAGDLKGIYEYIDPNTTIRSGKFRDDVAFTIVQNREANDLYRIFNTDRQDSFDVHFGGTGAEPVPARLSLDVSANATISITAAANVSGIYDYLDVRNAVQPGRFALKLDHGQTHTIINLLGATGRALYRVHNSGGESLIIKRGADVVASELKEDQSIDFDIRSNDTDKKVTVSPFAAGTSIPIQGMYEYLGR
jgi:hypothetical protein